MSHYDQAETLSKAAQSRGENMMINRACEIFVHARGNLGDDLCGSSLVDLIADNSGYPLDACRELAEIVVERCECSVRLRETYGERDQVPRRIVEHHFAAGDAAGLSMRMVESISRGGSQMTIVIERDCCDDSAFADVERLELNRAEAKDLLGYLIRTAGQKFWQND